MLGKCGWDAQPLAAQEDKQEISDRLTSFARKLIPFATFKVRRVLRPNIGRF